MRKTLEAIFRHPLRLVFLLVLLPVLSFGVAYMLPRQYTSTATLWALQRYQIIGATGAETDLLATPADTQATALTELLQSQTLALEVANSTSLPSTLSPSVQNDPATRDTALYKEISTNVKVVAQGYNLYTITYTNAKPAIANQVVQAVINTFALASVGFTVVEGQRYVQAYQAQLVTAKKAADDAAAAEAQYILNHPHETAAQLPSDPQYSLLHAQTQQAQATVANLQTQIATISQEISTVGTNADNLYQVLDQPSAKPASRVRLLLLSAGSGLGVALLASIIYVVILVRRDRALYGPADVARVTPHPVLLQIPRVGTRPAALSVIAAYGASMPSTRRR